MGICEEAVQISARESQSRCCQWPVSLGAADPPWWCTWGLRYLLHAGRSGQDADKLSSLSKLLAGRDGARWAAAATCA